MLLLVFSSLNQMHGWHEWVTMLGNKIGRSTDNGEFLVIRYDDTTTRLVTLDVLNERSSKHVRPW